MRALGLPCPTHFLCCCFVLNSNLSILIFISVVLQRIFLKMSLKLLQSSRSVVGHILLDVIYERPKMFLFYRNQNVLEGKAEESEIHKTMVLPKTKAGSKGTKFYFHIFRFHSRGVSKFFTLKFQDCCRRVFPNLFHPDEPSVSFN